MEVAVCIFCRGALEADVTKVVQRKLVEIYDAVMVEVSALKLCIHVLLNAPPRLHVTPRLECCSFTASEYSMHMSVTNKHTPHLFACNGSVQHIAESVQVAEHCLKLLTVNAIALATVLQEAGACSIARAAPRPEMPSVHRGPRCTPLSRNLVRAKVEEDEYDRKHLVRVPGPHAFL